MKEEELRQKIMTALKPIVQYGPDAITLSFVLMEVINEIAHEIAKEEIEKFRKMSAEDGSKQNSEVSEFPYPIMSLDEY